MTSLRTLQEEMKALVFPQDKERTSSFLWKEGLPERLSVYRNNARLNWADALDQDFALTRQQFAEEEWAALQQRFFQKHPPSTWELNMSLAPFPTFVATQKMKAYIRDLADYEWHDLKIFIDRATVQPGSGLTNPTLVVRVFQYQMFDWVQAGAPQDKPPIQKPEVLAFYRDSQNTCHIQEADPLMLLMVEHFRRPRARLVDLEPVRRELLPQNEIPLETVLTQLRDAEVIL